MISSDYKSIFFLRNKMTDIADIYNKKTPSIFGLKDMEKIVISELTALRDHANEQSLFQTVEFDGKKKEFFSNYEDSFIATIVFNYDKSSFDAIKIGVETHGSPTEEKCFISCEGTLQSTIEKGFFEYKLTKGENDFSKHIKNYASGILQHIKNQDSLTPAVL